jgi:hypothetical protein
MGQNNQEDLHVDYDLDDRFDQMAEISEYSEEVEELKPDEKGGHRIQVPDPEQIIAQLARHEHDRLESQCWEDQDYGSEFNLVPKAGRYL